MGKSKHHAGLHMIHFSKYGVYDDLEYYDELVLKKHKKEKVYQKIETVEVQKKQEEKLNYTQNEDEKIQVNKMEDGLKKQLDVKQQKMEEKQVKREEEFLIDINHFVHLQDVVSYNIMRIALQKKLDISCILNECENLMNRDKRINPVKQKLNWLMPKLDKSLVFLSILAEKMECNIIEFFLDNKDERKRFVYKLLEGLSSFYWETVYLDGEGENGEMSIYLRNFDFRYGMTEFNYGEKMARHEIGYDEYKSFRMDLEIEREYIDEIPNYSIHFGTKTVYLTDEEKYLIKGAYLWEEEEGELKEFAEKMFAEVKNNYSRNV